ncbi:MAG TPA: tyrosine-type recombinase/integrase [Kofleriaceae bacterium]|nr:tyrosine-type recombinase/integrase [Kofleriaceae bacterium]
MAIYKLGPEKYLVRIYFRGKPRSKVVNGTKRDAEKFEAKWRLELEAQDPGEYRTAPPFSDFCAGRYRIHAENHLKAKTWANRQYQIATLIEFFGTKPLDRISAAEVERFQNWRLKTPSPPRKEGGEPRIAGPAKVNDDTKVLKAILRYAISQNIPAIVPKIKPLPERKKKGRVKVWTEDEVMALYKEVQKSSPELLGMVAVMVNAGLRKGEVLALEWSCVDLDRGFLKIYPNDEWQPKNNEPREVPIGRAALPWLSGPQRGRFVFPVTRGNRKGQRYATWPQNQFDRARKAAGLEGGPHTCRHTYASHFLAACPDLFLLAEVLGHSHTRVTALYAHLLPDHLERARDAVCIPAPLFDVATRPEMESRK